jgi:DNA-binding transcriptional MerR regulator
MQLKQLVKALQDDHIQEKDILEWEKKLGLEIEIEDGVERYRPQHVQLFRSVQKQLRLGRTLEEIKSLLVLPARKDSVVAPKKELVIPAELKPTSVKVKNPVSIASTKAKATPKPIPPVSQEPLVQRSEQHVPLSESNPEMDRLLMTLPTPTATPVSAETAPPELSEAAFDIAPLRIVPDVEVLALEQPTIISSAVNQPAASGVHSQLSRLTKPQVPFQQALAEADSVSQNTGLLILVDRLVNDKDDLTAQVAELSRFNAHLNKVNGFYKRQLEELEVNLTDASQRINQLETLATDARGRLYRQDDKARLQQQVLEAERQAGSREQDIQRLRQELASLQKRTEAEFNPNRFVGTWLETATLRSVQFDTFGINIPDSRSRLFRITQAPERVYGQTAIIETQYDYRTNTLWKRLETLLVSHSHNASERRLTGELIVEYLLEGKTVAKASYSIDCQLQAEEARTSTSGIDKI